MLTLTELQNKFVAGLNGQSDEILEHIQPSNELSAQQHLDIYKSSIKGALQNTLKEIYPVCNKLVGDDFFIVMINEYIAQHYSQTTDLAGYGKSLPDFIQTFEPAHSVPYLADVAYLEWAWHTIFSAPPSKMLDLAKLQTCYVDFGEQIIFTLPPASTLMSSIYPLHLIWEANQDDNDEQITLPSHVTFYYLVWRKEMMMRVELLTEAQWTILSWIRKQLTLAEIVRKTYNHLPLYNIEEILPKMISCGWLTDFTVETKKCR